ncbi:MAG: homoserine kinase [Saprospiraceae bacterium]|nr:homoserine kinase [Saprospiraceae bacterium]
MARTSVKVWAPATVANVAVGYDILGFAIDGPGDEILLKRGTSKGLKIVEITGAKGKLPLDPMKNTAGVAAIKLLESLGAEDEPLEMSIRKKMPFGSGLGSSAASAVGGVFAVNELLKTGLSKREILRFAVEGEKVADGAWHADNVAPSLLGGMTFIRDNETLDVHKIYVPKGIQIVVIYPEVEVLTKDSRAVLSDSIQLNQHILQSGNLGGFIIGMYNSDFELIKRSLNDVIIEPQRAALIPSFSKMKEAALSHGALGFSISGAGPSMFAFCNNTYVAEKIVGSAEQIYGDQKIKVKTFQSGINNEGAFLF